MKQGDKVNIRYKSITTINNGFIKNRRVLENEIFTIYEVVYLVDITLYDIVDKDGFVYKGFEEGALQLVKVIKGHKLTKFFE